MMLSVYRITTSTQVFPENTLRIKLHRIVVRGTRIFGERLPITGSFLGLVPSKARIAWLWLFLLRDIRIGFSIPSREYWPLGRRSSLSLAFKDEQRGALNPHRITDDLGKTRELTIGPLRCSAALPKFPLYSANELRVYDTAEALLKHNLERRSLMQHINLGMTYDSFGRTHSVNQAQGTIRGQESIARFALVFLRYTYGEGSLHDDHDKYVV